MIKANKPTKLTTRKIATLAILCAMGLIMFMIESLFPPLFIPGAKMGLSNIVSLLTLVMYGPWEALLVIVVRTVMGSVFTGSMSTLMYSLTAGVVSTLVSAVLLHLVYPRISIISISVVSAVVHNLTQNIVFCAVTDTPEMYSYTPWLAMIGVLAGVIVGLAVYFVLKGMPYRVLSDVVLPTDSNREQEEYDDVDNVSQQETEATADASIAPAVESQAVQATTEATQPKAKKSKYHAGNSVTTTAKKGKKSKSIKGSAIYDRYTPSNKK